MTVVVQVMPLQQLQLQLVVVLIQVQKTTIRMQLLMMEVVSTLSQLFTFQTCLRQTVIIKMIYSSLTLNPHSI